MNYVIFVLGRTTKLSMPIVRFVRAYIAIKLVKIL